VKRQTLTAELSMLRRIAKGATKRGFLKRMPEIEGTWAARAWNDRVEVAEDRLPGVQCRGIDRILAELPESARVSSQAKDKTRYPVRARFIVAWETALRSATLNQCERQCTTAEGRRS
jgi:hypothetical protein